MRYICVYSDIYMYIIEPSRSLIQENKRLVDLSWRREKDKSREYGLEEGDVWPIYLKLCSTTHIHTHAVRDRTSSRAAGRHARRLKMLPFAHDSIMLYEADPASPHTQLKLAYETSTTMRKQMQVSSVLCYYFFFSHLLRLFNRNLKFLFVLGMTSYLYLAFSGI